MNSKIVFDKSCLSSFFWVQESQLLLELYGGNIIIPSKVKEEFDRLKKLKIPYFFTKEIEKICDTKKIENYDVIIGNNNISSEYIRLLNNPFKVTEGEAAAISITKEISGCIASNNFPTLQKQLNITDIKNIGAVDILCEAFYSKLRSLEYLEEIKVKMGKKNQYLPKNKLEEILKIKGLNI